MIEIIIIVIIIIYLYNKRKNRPKSVQENWNDYFKENPNTSIYYEARRPQFRDDKRNTNSPAFPWRFVLFIIYILSILYRAM